MKNRSTVTKVELDLNSSYRSMLPTFIQICESIAKKSSENECDGQTDRLRDGGRDGQTECKPIVPSGFTGGGLIKKLYNVHIAGIISDKICNNYLNFNQNKLLISTNHGETNYHLSQIYPSSQATVFESVF